MTVHWEIHGVTARWMQLHRRSSWPRSGCPRSRRSRGPCPRRHSRPKSPESPPKSPLRRRPSPVGARHRNHRWRHRSHRLRLRRPGSCRRTPGDRGADEARGQGGEEPAAEPEAGCATTPAQLDRAWLADLGPGRGPSRGCGVVAPKLGCPGRARPAPGAPARRCSGVRPPNASSWARSMSSGGAVASMYRWRERLLVRALVL